MEIEIEKLSQLKTTTGPVIMRALGILKKVTEKTHKDIK